MDLNKVSREVLMNMKPGQSFKFKLSNYNACLTARTTCYYVKHIEGNTDYSSRIDASDNSITITKRLKK